MSVHLNPADSSCCSALSRVATSKWTQSALLVGALALVIIGSLAGAHFLHCGSAVNQSHLGAGLFLGGVALGLVQIRNIAHRKSNRGLSQNETKQLLDYVDLHAKEHFKKNEQGWSEQFFISTATAIIHSKAFQEDPEGALKRQQTENTAQEAELLNGTYFDQTFYNDLVALHASTDALLLAALQKAGLAKNQSGNN